MIRGRWRGDNLVRNNHFLSKNQKFVWAGPTGHSCRRWGREQRGGEGRGWGRRRRRRRGWGW
jgi:hypothetical protein